MKLTELTVESQQVRSFITHRTRMTQKDKSFCQSVTKSHNTIREPGREREDGPKSYIHPERDRSRVRHLHGEAKITHVVGTLSASADWLTITKGTVYPALSSAPAASCLLPAPLRHRLTTCQGTQTRLFVGIFGPTLIPPRIQLEHESFTILKSLRSWRHMYVSSPAFISFPIYGSSIWLTDRRSPPRFHANANFN